MIQTCYTTVKCTYIGVVRGFEALAWFTDLGLKLYSVGEAAKNMNDLRKKTKLTRIEQAHLVAQGFFVVAQTVDIILPVCKNISSLNSKEFAKLSIGSRSMTACADLARTGTKAWVKGSFDRNQKINIIAVFVFRLGDVSLAVTSCEAEIFHCRDNLLAETARKTAKIFPQISTAIKSRKLLAQLPTHLNNILVSIFKAIQSNHQSTVTADVEQELPLDSIMDMTDPFLEWLHETRNAEQIICPLSGSFLLKPASPEEDSTLFFEYEEIQGLIESGAEYVMYEDKQYRLNGFRLYGSRQNRQQERYDQLLAEYSDVVKRKLEEELTELSNKRKLTRVPEKLLEEVVFKTSICSISNLPTLKPYKPKNYDPPKGFEPIIYDKQRILEWLAASPSNPPRNWPREIPFTREHLVRDHIVRKMIKATLDKHREQSAAYSKISSDEPSSSGSM